MPVKPRLDLLPAGALTEIAQVLTFGAEKYGAHNWSRGTAWSRYYAALLRHLFAWWGGEDRDPETGASHLAHAGCCLLFLLEYQRHGWGSDDRGAGPDGARFRKDDGASPPQPSGGDQTACWIDANAAQCCAPVRDGRIHDDDDGLD
jgi:hypothetical protein